MNHDAAFTIWLTGRSGAGKTTLALCLAERMRLSGLDKVEVLDGDHIGLRLRDALMQESDGNVESLSRILTAGQVFAPSEIATMVALSVAYMAGLLSRNGVPVIAAVLAPYRATRSRIRDQLGHVIEVFVDCPPEVCRQRDPKGLYSTARGNRAGFDIYEPPLHPEIRLRTDVETVEESADQVMAYLDSRGYLPTIGRKSPAIPI